MSLDKINRIVATAHQLANAKGITARHQIDTLAGILSRSLASGQSERVAYETARIEAGKMAAERDAKSAIDQLLNSLQTVDNLLLSRQAL